MSEAKEERKLVTAMSELGVGMLVVDIRCWCGRQHTSLIIDDGVVDEPGHHAHDTPCFLTVGCGQDPDDGKDAIIDAEIVAAGRIYRILDGLDPDKDAFEDSMDDYASGILAAAYKIVSGDKVHEKERR